jgi:hypothetical protein
MNLDFQLERHPIVLTRPSVVPPYGWVGHIPFAYLAIDLLRPGRVVELGTHSGNSYLAMCQAVQKLGLSTQCFAVDTWEGDSHASHYGEQIYQSLRARHDPRYADFSRLIRGRFDDALQYFQDASVDLLHIDGLHTYEAVKHDFETWLPKLSNKAVVLMHDTATEDRGFGVHRFFDELSSRYSCFNFLHSHGLGVVAVGGDVPAPFSAFMRNAQSDPVASRAYFEALADILVDENGHLRGGIHEPQPVVCHLYYRDADKSFDDAQKISIQADAAEGTTDVRFRLPSGVSPDYLRIDPSDFPGVYSLQVWLGGEGSQKLLERLYARLGHVNGELLVDAGSQHVRFASFDDDPYVEFEVGSDVEASACANGLEVVVRLNYEVVVSDPSVRRLMERQALAEMRELSHARIDVQGVTRELSARMAKMEQAIEKLSRRSLWSWIRGR